MNSRRAQAWVWWLLPLLSVRALLPVGFMAQAHDGQFNVVLCSAGFAKAKPATQATSPQQDERGHRDRAQADLTCPFAHAGGAVLPVVISSFVADFSSATNNRPAPVLPDVSARVVNAHRVRGPPLFS